MKNTTLKIIEAVDFAKHAHSGQFRKDGVTPYVYHPLKVATTLFKMDEVTEDIVIAALLHDVLEDCKHISANEIKDKFGENVLKLVQELTNASKENKNLSRTERKALDRKKIANISKEAKLIKLADRIDNLRDLNDHKDDFKKLYKEESRLLLNECLLNVNNELESTLRSLL